MGPVQEQANVKVTLNNEEAKREIEELNSRIEKLIQLKKKAESEGDVKGFTKISTELNKAQREAKKYEKQLYDVEKALKNINGASWDELRRAEVALEMQTKKLTRGTEEYIRKSQQLKLVRGEMANIRAEQSAHVPVWSRMANGANKYFNVIVAGLAALTGIVFSAKEWVKGLVGLDDQLADVMKTTGMTRKEVREMYTEFKYFNTRTPRKELLLLAEEAGRLGKESKKDVMDFVEVANMIKVSLGDDLGGNAEEAIREVGKLVEIYNVGSQYGTDFRKSMEKVGSGINEVAASSNAQAPFLIEYMKRMGGIAAQAKISAANIMGYASTFDQLGQNVEMAATAQSKVIVDMFTDPGKYAKIARMEVGEFAKLLNTDANEAFIKLLEGLNGNNDGLMVLSSRLDELDIDGARAIQALAALSSKTEVLRKQQVIANDAMNEGVSLSNEYNLKNNNLAGSLDKIGQYLHSKFVNSKFLGWVEKVVAKTAEWVKVSPIEKLQKEQTEVNLLAIELTNANTPAERRNEIYNELNKIAPDVVKNIDIENISISTLRENLEKYNTAMIKKLALQDSEITLEDKRKAAGEATSERMAREVELIGEFNSILKQSRAMATTMNDKYAESLEQIIYSDDDIINKTQRIHDLLGKDRVFYRTNAEGLRNGIIAAREAEKKAMDDVNDALTAYMQKYEMLNGKGGTDAGTPKKGDKKTVGNTVFEWDGNSWKVVQVLSPGGGGGKTDDKGRKEASEKEIEALDAAHNAIMQKLIQQYELESWTDARYKTQQLIAEQAYLEEKRKILLKYRQSTVDIDSKINDKRVDAQKELNALMSEQDKEFLREMDDSTRSEREIIELSVDETTESIKSSVDEIKKAKDKEKQILEQRAQTYQQISNTIVGSLSSALDGSLDEYATYGDALVLMALQILKQMAPIWAAQIVGGSLATPDSIMTGNIKGIIQFTAALAIMEGFIAVAEGAVKKGIDKRREKGQKARQYASGKYPVIGADDGRLYDTNYAGRPKTRIYSGPQLGIFNENPSEPELVVDGKTTRQLIINYPAIYRGIRQMAAGFTPQFAGGKYPSTTSQPYTPATPSFDPETLAVMREFTRAMNTIAEEGVPVSWQMFEKLRNKKERMEKGSGL